MSFEDYLYWDKAMRCKICNEINCKKHGVKNEQDKNI